MPPGFTPSSEAPDDHVRIKSIFPQDVRHPGARGFARSSTVQINVLFPGETLHLFFQIIRLNPDRAENALGSSVPTCDNAFECLCDDGIISRLDNGREPVGRQFRALQIIDVVFVGSILWRPLCRGFTGHKRTYPA